MKEGFHQIENVSLSGCVFTKDFHKMVLSSRFDDELQRRGGVAKLRVLAMTMSKVQLERQTTPKQHHQPT